MKTLFFETDASKVVFLELDYWKKQKGMIESSHVPGNFVLKPIAFESKSLPTAETEYSNVKSKTFAILDGLIKCQHIIIWYISKGYSWSYSTCSHFSEICCNIDTKTTTYTTGTNRVPVSRYWWVNDKREKNYHYLRHYI